MTKFSLRHVPNPHTNQIIHEVELWVKDSKGRRKLDLIVKCSKARSNGSNGDKEIATSGNGWVLDGTNDEMEREYRAFDEVVEDMRRYLRQEKGVADPEQFLCLPMRYLTDMASVRLSEEESLEGSDRPMLVLQDLFTAGYHSAQQERLDESGLDFNHSIMAISRLARFHAVSYAMRKEKDVDFLNEYPFLRDDPVYRADTVDMFAKTQTSIATRLFSIFQHSSKDLRDFSNFFLDAVRRLHAIQTGFVSAPSDKFGVLCHGDLWRQNVLFFYGSSLECQTDCVDVRFEDLHRVRYASCVTDLLYFLFTTVDFDVRRDHMMDFLAVYHDHFAKTVAKLSKHVEIFSREELFKEFKSHLMFGFLEGICLFSAVYESQLRRANSEADEDDEDGSAIASAADNPPRYADYKEAVVAMIGDVIRLKFQGESDDKTT